MNKYEKENLTKKKDSIINNIQFQEVFMKMDIEELTDNIMRKITEKGINCDYQMKEDIYILVAENVKEVVDCYMKKFKRNMNSIIENIENEFLFKKGIVEGEKRKKGRPKKFNIFDSTLVVMEYKKTNSVKKVIEKYKSMGKSISDKQIRNILEEAGVYKKKARKT